MATKSQRDYEKEVRSWGFSHVFTWSDSPYMFAAAAVLLRSAFEALP
ncbi:hypothetical protein M7I_0409 [Glarea lozoyensis 74030]|uniref:Uncharacterized protein n=1 Tax=Glarea lozoyensis (strain ATCC 74030 / MF5533) TaxID=1104152 RepID=H0EDA4_GLAL7|nr:hypothetical protein M7I_0409 [Glarea lozoyensis 74030]